MKKFPKPWYRPGRGVWYVTIDGKQHNLGPDEAEALKLYHELLASQAKHVPRDGSVISVIDEFLDWCSKNRADATYQWYLDRLQTFVDSLPPGLSVSRLTPGHVRRWVDSFDGHASGSKRNNIRAVKRAMKWAEEDGLIDRSPIAYMKKPRGGHRDRVISKAEYEELLSETRDQEFRDLLTVGWETGVRPQEVLAVEARHVDIEFGRWVFPQSEEKMERAPRVVYLTETALAITRRLMLKWPDGRLFRNTRGVPWTTDAVNCRFTTLKRKLGYRVCLYNFRHTWMNRLLKSGVDSLTVAVLAGHSDASILARTYQHLSQDPSYLREAARRVSA